MNVGRLKIFQTFENMDLNFCLMAIFSPASSGLGSCAGLSGFSRYGAPKKKTADMIQLTANVTTNPSH